MATLSLESNRGYIALASVLIIASVLVLVSLTQALVSVNEGQSSLGGLKKDNSLNFVDSCGEDALIKLNKNGSVPATIYLPSGTCVVTINGNVGTGWTFTVVGSQENYYKSITIQATRSTSVTLTDWREN